MSSRSSMPAFSATKSRRWEKWDQTLAKEEERLDHDEASVGM